MLRPVILAVVATMLVLAGCSGALDDSLRTTEVTPPPTTQTTNSPTTTVAPETCARQVDVTTATDTKEQLNVSLLSVTDLYREIGTEDCENDEVGLYYVDRNGTWYHASPNGGIGAPAPEGNDSKVAPIEFQLSPDERPAFVWRVYRGSRANECPYTRFFDAETGSYLGWIPVPCPTPPPTSTAN